MEVHNYDSTSERLLHCPFCGSVPTWYLKGNEFTRSQKIVIKCPKCRIQRTDAILNGRGHTTEWLEEVAIKHWNQRTKETETISPEEMLDMLRMEYSKGRYDTISKAIEWLDEHLLEYWGQQNSDPSEFIIKFKKSMELGQKQN